MSDSRRRGSRLFSGQPGLLLVSEDIPGITMPAPPPKNAAPLEEEEPEFDLAALHAEEDEAEAEQGQEGPLRVFLGGGAPDLPVEQDEASNVFDVSALAMPDAEQDAFEESDGLSFLDETEEDDEIVPLGDAPPPLTMQESSLVDAVVPDPAESWDDGPTIPAMQQTAVIRDQAPNVAPASDADPLDAPERDPFVVGEEGLDDFADDVATRVDAIAAEVEPADVWDDDQVTAFFEGEADNAAKQGLPASPPQLKVEPPPSRSFKAVPDKADPPVIPVLVLLVGIVIMSLVLWARYAGGGDGGSVAQQPIPVAPASKPAPTPVVNTPAAEDVIDQMGYLTVDADKPANIYVGDRKMGITPIVKIEVQPGNHRVLAVEVETGKRKALTAQVVQGEERRVRFEFRVGRL